MALQKNTLTFNATAAKHCNFTMQLDIARTAGFSAVELTGGPVEAYLDAGYSQRELKASLDGLQVQGIGALLDIERTGEQGREMMAQAEKLYDLANLVGAKGVQLVTGPLDRSEEHTSELQSHHDLVCRLLLEKKKKKTINTPQNTKRTTKQQQT